MGCCCSSPIRQAERVYFEDLERRRTTSSGETESSTRALRTEPSTTQHQELDAQTPAQQESGDTSVPPPAYSLHDELSSSRSHQAPTLPKSPVANSAALVRPQELQSGTPPDLIDVSGRNECQACGRRLATGSGSSSAHDDGDLQCNCAGADRIGSTVPEDTTGVEPDNPHCNCGQPSRCLITDKSSDRRFFYRCATGRCWFFQWQ